MILNLSLVIRLSHLTWVHTPRTWFSHTHHMVLKLAHPTVCPLCFGCSDASRGSQHCNVIFCTCSLTSTTSFSHTTMWFCGHCDLLCSPGEVLCSTGSVISHKGPLQVTHSSHNNWHLAQWPPAFLAGPDWPLHRLQQVQSFWAKNARAETPDLRLYLVGGSIVHVPQIH